MGVNCLQIWNGNIEPSTERDKFKLFVDAFIKIFKSTDLIESLEKKGIGNGMSDISVKYKVLPEEIHIIYQDLRSGDKDDNPKKDFR